MIWELSKDISEKRELMHKKGELDAKLVGFLDGAVKMLKSSGGPYLGGSKMGYGDLGMFHALYTFEQVKPGFIKPWKELDEFVTSVAALPAISQYLNSPRRVPLSENELGKGHTGISGYKYVSPLNPLTVAEPYDKQ